MAMSEYTRIAERARAEVTPKRVLIACEYSGIVRDAFIAAGHDAISCDLLPTERPGPHIQGDVRELLREPWDLVVAHPPCTYLTVARGTPSDDDDAILQAIEFFIDCQQANATRIAVENPTVYKFVRDIVGEPTQAVQPYHFGDPVRKRTCWWLRGIPPLMAQFGGADQNHICSIVDSGSGRKGGRSMMRRNPKERARFHLGMAAAMARQWGSL